MEVPSFCIRNVMCVLVTYSAPQLPLAVAEVYMQRSYPVELWVNCTQDQWCLLHTQQIGSAFFFFSLSLFLTLSAFYCCWSLVTLYGGQVLGHCPAVSGRMDGSSTCVFPQCHKLGASVVTLTSTCSGLRGFMLLSMW